MFIVEESCKTSWPSDAIRSGLFGGIFLGTNDLGQTPDFIISRLMNFCRSTRQLGILF